MRKKTMAAAAILRAFDIRMPVEFKFHRMAAAESGLYGLTTPPDEPDRKWLIETWQADEAEMEVTILHEVLHIVLWRIDDNDHVFSHMIINPIEAYIEATGWRCPKNLRTVSHRLRRFFRENLPSWKRRILIGLLRLGVFSEKDLFDGCILNPDVSTVECRTENGAHKEPASRKWRAKKLHRSNRLKGGETMGKSLHIYTDASYTNINGKSVIGIGIVAPRLGIKRSTSLVFSGVKMTSILAEEWAIIRGLKLAKAIAKKIAVDEIVVFSDCKAAIANVDRAKIKEIFPDIPVVLKHVQGHVKGHKRGWNNEADALAHKEMKRRASIVAKAEIRKKIDGMSEEIFRDHPKDLLLLANLSAEVLRELASGRLEIKAIKTAIGVGIPADKITVEMVKGVKIDPEDDLIHIKEDLFWLPPRLRTDTGEKKGGYILKRVNGIRIDYDVEAVPDFPCKPLIITKTGHGFNVVFSFRDFFLHRKALERLADPNYVPQPFIRISPKVGRPDDELQVIAGNLRVLRRHEVRNLLNTTVVKLYRSGHGDLAALMRSAKSVWFTTKPQQIYGPNILKIKIPASALSWENVVTYWLGDYNTPPRGRWARHKENFVFDAQWLLGILVEEKQHFSTTPSAGRDRGTK